MRAQHTFTLCLRALALGTALLAHEIRAEVPALKAHVEEPALQETMGGCSLKCAFAWTVAVESPGGVLNVIKTLNDENAETSWIAVPPTSGVGVKFYFRFPKKLISELEGTPVYGLDLINGVWRSEQEWLAHGRIKRVRLTFNGKPFCTATFANNRRWQRLAFPDILIHSGDSMTMEILEVYPGTREAGVAITEIVLQGAH